MYNNVQWTIGRLLLVVLVITSLKTTASSTIMLYEHLRIPRNKRKYIVLLILTFGAFVITLLKYDMAIGLFYTQYDNITCHHILAGDVLPQMEVRFNPPPRSIYFHETSCPGNLDSRQACAVESAARAHHLWQIYILFTGPVTEEYFNKTSYNVLKRFENIKILRLHIMDYAKGTPLEDLVWNGKLNKSLWPASHTSDVLRYLTLYKWGGVYLDLDVVVVKSFDDLAMNWAAREDEGHIAAGALSFSRDGIGRFVANAAVNDLKQEFRGNYWGHNGPGTINRTLIRLCGTTNASVMTSKKCKGFEVYPPNLFYPVKWQNSHQYFKPAITIPDPYMHHIWNKRTHTLKVKKNSLYAKLAQNYCPSIYSHYGNSFGT